MATFAQGTQFARHRIVRLLGEGEAAEVYEVIAPDGRRRALKIIKAGVPVPSTLQARLAQEGEAIAMIDQVHVVRLYDAGMEHGRVWLLLELVEGPDLRTLATQSGGALPVTRAVRLVRQAAEGVAAAHALGILHRDLRPENILVAADDLAKVADFGSAKLHGWGVRTTTQQASASSLYMAPEQMRGQVPGPAGDVYALAVVLHELLVGEHPIAPRTASPMVVCERQLTFDPPPLASLGRDLPGDLSDLVRRALAKDPAHRPSMRAFAEGLAGVLQRLLAPLRAVARNVPLPRREHALARTSPLPRPREAPATSPFPLPFSASTLDYDVDRSAVLPPDSLGVAAPAFAGSVLTLRSPITSTVVRTGSRAPSVTVVIERASTPAPVVRAASSPSNAPSPRWPFFVLAALALAVTMLTVGWVVIGGGRGPDARVTASGPVIAAPSVSAGSSASPAASAAAPLVPGARPR